MRFVLAVAAAVLLLSCAKTPTREAGIRVEVVAQTPLDCIRVTVSDENTGPPSTLDLPAVVGVGEERRLLVAVYRREEWGTNAVFKASGFRGGCERGVEVTRSELGRGKFVASKEIVPVVTLTLTGVDADKDGYVDTLVNGSDYDCNDSDPLRHPEASELCEGTIDLDCDSQIGCQRVACFGKNDFAGKRCCPGGATTVAETVCADNADNDCDGLLDCADSDCADKQCDSGGRRCVSLNSCACPGNATVETNCNDGKDDDCDGLTDCADAECLNKVCGIGICRGVTCCIVNADGGVQSSTEICTDGVDNDCNGKSDCADPACAGQSAGGGQLCCGASLTAVPATEPANACGNALDDDCDAQPDCADPDCTGDVCQLTPTTPGLCSAFVCRGESCTNFVDDNGDGKVDCADPLCASASCDSFGSSCVGTSCVCPGGAAEGLDGGACADTADNDCDGKTDCADPGCNGLRCANGKTCQTNACVCALGEPAEVSCSDNADNDCDGNADCGDSDCAGRACSGTGGVCTNGACACVSGSESACGNGADDNCNGQTDCADSACNSAACGAFGRVCAAGVCSCPATTEVCTDGIDNDCDGLIDCQDTTPCANATSCDARGRTCNGGACLCPFGQGLPDGGGTELSCADGVDNDCDGNADCADSNCANQTCNANGRRCVGTVCTCTGGGTELCATPGDEDCNGLSDCADPSCTTGVSCGPNGRTCSAAKQCICPFGQTRETSCGDGQDNDCDGTSDCADGDCSGMQCSSTGGQNFCCGGSCASTNVNGDCGYCSLKCGAGFTCSTVPQTSPAWSTCNCNSSSDCAVNHVCHNFGNGVRRCVECDTTGPGTTCPTNHPSRPVCNLQTFVCYCPPGTLSCTPTCTTNEADAGASGGNPCTGATPYCNVLDGKCVGCLSNAQCMVGQTCVNLACQ